MKLALVGSSGYIAGHLLGRFKKHMDDILKIDCTQDADAYLDLLEASNFHYSILDGTDVVVFTAAVSGPDQCAEEFEKCWEINVDGTIYFIKQAVKRGCKVLFFSSDAVFGDICGAIYDENSQTEAATPYGKMKKAVEDAFRGETLFKTIRLSYVVSAQDRFVTYCLNCLEKEVEAEIFHPFYRNCITISDVAEVVLWMSGHWDEYQPQVLNVAGEELVSRIRIADELNRILGKHLSYTVKQPDDAFFVNRPRITQMKSLYLNQYGILQAGSFTEKVQKELSELAVLGNR